VAVNGALVFQNLRPSTVH